MEAPDRVYIGLASRFSMWNTEKQDDNCIEYRRVDEESQDRFISEMFHDLDLSEEASEYFELIKSKYTIIRNK